MNQNCIGVVVLLFALSCGGGGTPGVTPTDRGADPGPDLLPDAGEADPETPPAPCTSNDQCEDQNPCTLDTCEADGCHHDPVVSGACDDGDPCTQGESCDQGRCTGGTFVCECQKDLDCGPSATPCHLRTCNQQDHTCVEAPVEDLTPCDDGNPCTAGEACFDGECRGGADVCDCENDAECPAPADPCSPLHCDLTDHKCKAAPRKDGEACEDGDLCTQNDQCDQGHCKAGPRKDCDDQNDCTSDSCNPASGACENVYQPGFGCCASEKDCDDGDLCTIEACVAHRCEYSPEPAGASGFGCVAGDGCAVGFCSEADGLCRSLDLGLPAVLFDWDLTQGTRPRGMRWTTAAGELTESGAGPKSGEALAAFAFPAHVAPEGVRVLLVTLSDGLDCTAYDQVSVVANGAAPMGPTECRIEAGRAVLGFAILAQNRAPLDLEVQVESGAHLARVTLYQWAVAGCRPLDPRVAVEGTNLSDLSVAGLRTAIGVGHRLALEKPRVGTYSLWNSVKAVANPTVQDLMDGHRTSIVPYGVDRWLFAYDGHELGQISGIEVALIHLNGGVLAVQKVPKANGSVEQRDPVLWTDQAGHAYLAYSASGVDPDGFGVAFRSVALQNGALTFGAEQRINVDPGGDQTSPVVGPLGVVGSAGENAIVVWRSKLANATKPYRLSARKVSATGPVGSEPLLDQATTPFLDLAVTEVDGGFLVAATRASDDSLVGYRVASDLSSYKPWAYVLDGEWRNLALLPAPPGAALVATYQNGAPGSRVVIVPVSALGEMGTPAALTGLINVLSPTAVGAFGPFAQVLAFYDPAAAQKGVRVQAFSARCANGPVVCEPNTSKVCVGLGADGYVSLPWVWGWCP